MAAPEGSGLFTTEEFDMKLTSFIDESHKQYNMLLELLRGVTEHIKGSSAQQETENHAGEGLLPSQYGTNAEKEGFLPEPGLG